MKCRNTHYDHECHPYYAKKYHGYCRECEAAGVPEFIDQLRAVQAALAQERAEHAQTLRCAGMDLTGQGPKPTA